MPGFHVMRGLRARRCDAGAFVDQPNNLVSYSFMSDLSSHLIALERILAELDSDIRANPDPRFATREKLVAAIEYIRNLSANDANQVDDLHNRRPVSHHSVLIAPEVTGKPRSRSNRFRDVMVAYLREHGSTHHTKLAKVCVERNLFETEREALKAQTRLFRVWREVFVPDGNGYFQLIPNASTNAKPKW